METFLGVDVGTTVTKATLFDEAGTSLAVVERATRLEQPAPDRVEQDVEEVLASVAEVIAELLRSSTRQAPSLLAITGQGDGCWLVDERGWPTRKAVSWMDARSSGVLAEWERDGTAESVFRVTGNALFPGAQACILRWLDQHEPDALDRASTATYCKDVIFQRLTGVRATDPSDASLPFGRPDGAGYSEQALKLCRLDHRAGLLPPVTGPVPVAPLDAAGAALTTLAEGTPVTAGPFDLSACPAGAGVTEPGDGLLIIGTTLACTVVTDTVDVQTRAGATGMHLATTRPGRWLRVLPAMVGSASLDWVLGMLGKDHDDLDAAIAGSVAGAGGVEMLPYLSPSGERAPFVDAGARGQLTGLRLTTAAADVIRATCEGIAYAARDCFASTPLEGEVVVCGGGARSRRWLQVFADVLQRPLTVTPDPNVGPRGAVLGGLEAMGHAVDRHAWLPPGDVVAPDRRLAESYERGFARFTQHREAARPLWRSS
ncbi:xylulokinase/erythritol kinase [Haloechinothrix alba]|uniref:Xylulokinase/erythritol kinase n=1 Tax=Haloechinothrix alba TaxID=664784 RepID=A0A238XLW2_9PSEU|nr:FGGY-family carbohydrate kinase [Haloechinothrix alba]SNR59453.1 xylulokinase/erythritol kinase [Haloechinothrix alba]